MSEVKRYWFQGLEVVESADYDAAQSELAALREELAQTKDVLATANRTLGEFADDSQIYQQRLTTAEQRNADDLRNAERYRSLRKVTPYRFKKMQDASVTDGGDVLYFHADKFDALMDIEMTTPDISSPDKVEHRVPNEHSMFEDLFGDSLMGNRHRERFARDSCGVYLDPEVRSLWTGFVAKPTESGASE